MSQASFVSECRRFFQRVLFYISIAALVLGVGNVRSWAVDNLSFELDGNTKQDDLSTPLFDWENFFGNNADEGVATHLPDISNYPGFQASGFLRDTSNDDLSIFSGGQSSDPINLWQCTTGSAPDKDDIQRAYGLYYLTPSDAVLYFGAERLKNTGNAFLGIWFLQDDTVGCAAPHPPLTGSANFTGHHKDGDLFLSAAFTNSGTNINVYKWDCPTADPLNPAECDTPGIGSFNTIPFLSGVKCTGSGSDICAIVNSALLPNPPWLDPGEDLKKEEFLEGGVNLAALLPDNTGKKFNNFLVTSRASSSPSSALKDYLDVKLEIFQCEDDSDCVTKNSCEVGTCQITNPQNGTGFCKFDPADQGTVCRAKNGVCDKEEVCDGENTACPDDDVEDSSTQCRAQDGACDVAEFCDGTNKGCPTDGVASAGATCRAKSGDCDVAETCNGTLKTCPADGYVAGGTECRVATGACDQHEVCTGSSATCPADGANLTTQCRAPNGPCDVAEFCSDASDDCPADSLVAAGTECRAATGVCDQHEVCDGSNAACPADGPNLTTQCRASNGVCDLAESCSDASDDCPADGPNLTTQCRASNGPCDTAEFCSDANDDCPADGFVAAGTECRASTGECDQHEVCNGSNAACPEDGPNLTTQCRASNGVCDLAEFCSDASDDCPADGPNLTTQCRASNGPCDVAESCSDASDDCPADGFKSAGTECRAATGECDLHEVCDGSTATCPADGPNLTTQCRASNGVCDPAEFCSDENDSCPTDTKSTEVCRPAVGECDLPESCNGVSDNCPANALKPDGTLCTDDGENDCNTAKCMSGSCDQTPLADGATCSGDGQCNVEGGSGSICDPTSCDCCPDEDNDQACDTCGDNIIHTGEACDGSSAGSCLLGCQNSDAGDSDGDGNACACKTGCGDGIPQDGEECDDGNHVNTDGCKNDCTENTCGDGYKEEGVEECDEGASNSNDPNATCRTDCTLPKCGDHIVDGGAPRHEECDSADPNACGTNLACLDDCTCAVASCGNHVVEGSEGCEAEGDCAAGENCNEFGEDDNTANDCTCVPATCGDTEVDPPDEQCETDADCNPTVDAIEVVGGPQLSCIGCKCCPDSDNDGACDVCGDNIIHPGEACDGTQAGNCLLGCDTGDADGDQNKCECKTGCGDGIPQEGEQCDDGNNVSGDGCDATCHSEICGDNKVNNDHTPDNTEDNEQCDGTDHGVCGDNQICTPSCACCTDVGGGGDNQDQPDGQCDECVTDADCKSDGQFCNGTEKCVTGVCKSVDAPNCAELLEDDGNSCTDPICDPTIVTEKGKGECVHQPDDNNGCTLTDKCLVGDHCEEGKCVGTPKVCEDDGRTCTPDLCDTSSGECIHPATGCKCDKDSQCDDNNPCTNNPCDVSSGTCAEVTYNIGIDCNDKNSETFNDHCGGGADDPADTLGVCIGDIPPTTISFQAQCTANILATAELYGNGSGTLAQKLTAEEVALQVKQIMAEGGTLKNCVTLPSLTGGSLQGDLEQGVAADNLSCKSQLQPGSRGNPYSLLLPAFATLGLVGWRRKLVRAKR